MKKSILAALVLGFSFTAVSHAGVSIDFDTGVGFVGKGDVQDAFGWNNAQLQENAAGVSFTYMETGTYTFVCEGHSNANQNPKTYKNKEVGTVTSISTELRKGKQGEGQVNGFNLQIDVDNPTVSGEGCPSAWPIEVSRTLNEGAGEVVGLFVNFGESSVQLNWPVD